MIPASDAIPGKRYHRTPGHKVREFAVHPETAAEIIARLSARPGELKGAQVDLLARLRQGCLPFRMFGPVNKAVALDPDQMLVEVKPVTTRKRGSDPYPFAKETGPSVHLDRLIGPTVAPGVYPSMSIDDYHASSALSSSGLKKIGGRSIDHYIHGRQYPEKKRAFDFGHAVHAWVLEGRETFEALCVSSPFDSMRTKAAKEWRAEQEAEGRIILSSWDMRCVELAVRNVENHPTASNIMATGVPETSYFWNEDVDGVLVPCRVRTDWMVNNWIVDLKTTRDASPRAFNKSVANFGYAPSLSLYMRGVERVTGVRPEGVLIVAVESEPPHSVAVYQLSDDWLDVGERKIDEWLETVAGWLTAAEPWTGYETGIHLLEPPSWA